MELFVYTTSITWRFSKEVSDMLRNIEAERARNGYTREGLSLELGITSKTYKGYLTGTPIPSTMLIKMSDLFGCRIDYLLDLTDERTK
jgi:DNA-binding XRE family transcriptional regulator